MRTFIRFLLFVLPVFIMISDGYAQKDIITKLKLNLATNEVVPRLGKPYVVITWPSSESYTQYNLYRKSSPFEQYPETPLNGKVPISILENCDEIKAWIPEGSADWELIANTIGGEDDPYDPCAIAEIPRPSSQYERLQMLARSNWKIAVIAGQGFQDLSTSYGATYYYELRGVVLRTQEEVVLGEGAIVAGSPTPLPEPENLSAIADDSKVLVLWDDVDNAAGYIVYRSTSPLFASPQRVNDATIPARFTHDLQGATIPISSGFVDYMVWDDYGNPIPRDVRGVDITGPFNGETYYYKIAALDMLGYPGDLSSSTASATPKDMNSPMTPHEVQINANDPLNQLEIRWSRVEYDVLGHAEDSIQGYQVYRYEDPNEATTAVMVGGLIPQALPGFEFVSVIDNDPILRPPYGEQTFWYRIICIDSSGNESALSAAASGYLNDVTAPASPKGVRAEGFENFIRVMWDPNNEPDLDGYLIYRSLCEYGEWTCISEFGQQRREKDREKLCPEFFKLVGYVSKDEANAFIEVGDPPQFDDGSVSSEAPICYAYVVKAIDRTQNESGSLPPNLAEEKIVCQRIRDKTAPDPAIVTALLARDNANFIEWIGEPIQDIAAYHVYRSEKVDGPYDWVGGMTVERPSSPAAPLAAPYEPPAMVGCQDIALVPQEYMSTGTLLDKKIDPKVIYWYKVLGIDLNGNESKVEDAVAVSTFTFSTNTPPSPAINSVSVQSPTCALSV
ncbi:MAG: fibronectin type III domain-containing protein, partial [Candidatus Hinthialibacter sp.]